MKKFFAILLSAALLLALFVPAISAESKPYAGKTLTVLYMSSVYADAARAMVPEFE